MSDLTKRLRGWSKSNGAPIWDEAASRIEKLEGALRDFVQFAVDSGWEGPMIERARELLK